MAFYARLDKSVSFSLRPATAEDLAPYARDVAAQQRRLADRYRSTIQRMQQTPLHQQLVGGHTKSVDVAWTAAAAAAPQAETAMHIDVCETQDELVSLDALQLCQMHGVNYMGDHFVFLMSHSISSKTDSYVAHTRNPLRDVYLHNTRRLPETDGQDTAGRRVEGAGVSRVPFPAQPLYQGHHAVRGHPLGFVYIQYAIHSSSTLRSQGRV